MSSKAQAIIEISASSSRLGSALNEARFKFQSFSGSIARGIGSAFKAVNKKLELGGTAKHAVGNMLGDLGSKGVGAILDTAEAVREYERDLTRVRIASGQSAEWQQKLSRSIRTTSRDFGVGTDELSKAAGVYFDLTSDADGMAKSLDVFGKTALASGAQVDDLVKTAAALHDSMGIGSEEYESTFSGLIQQGKAGKISLKDMGQEFPSLLAMFSKFGTGRAGVMEMGAAFQVGAKAFGSASQAATGLEAMMGMLQARQAKLHKAGVEVYKVNKDGTVTMRGLHDIVQQISDKKIDPRKWGKIFGENKEGRNFLETLIKFPKLYDDIVVAGQDAGAVQHDSMEMAESQSGRLDLALNRLKVTVAEAFTPERIEGFVKAVEDLGEKLGPVVDLVGKAGDVLGGLSGVGKSVRGLFGDNGNPYVNGMLDVAGVMADPKSKRSQNATGYNKAAADILAGEKNERTSPESIRRAVFARFNENEGTATAGNRYLANALGSGEEVDATVRKVVKESLESLPLAELGKGIAEGLMGKIPAPVLKVGDNQVAAATTNATKPRRGAR